MIRLRKESRLKALNPELIVEYKASAELVDLHPDINAFNHWRHSVGWI